MSTRSNAMKAHATTPVRLCTALLTLVLNFNMDTSLVMSGGGAAEAQPLPATVSRFAYIANFSDGTLSAYTVDPGTGQLRHNGYALTGANPSSVAAHPSGRFVYVSNYADGERLFAYRVGADGRLASLGKFDWGSGLRARAIAVHPTRPFLYLALEGAYAVSTYAINADGTVRWVGDVYTVAAPSAVSVDSGGGFAYVTSSTANTVSAFSIGA